MSEQLSLERHVPEQQSTNATTLTAVKNRREWMKTLVALVVTASRADQLDAGLIPKRKEQSAEEIHALLTDVWREQMEELQQRGARSNARYRSIKMSLQHPKLQEFEKAWEERMKEFSMTQGLVAMQVDHYCSVLRTVEKMLDEWDVQTSGSSPSAEHSPVQIKRRELEKKHALALLTLPNGRNLRLYPKEKQRKPSLTSAEYLDQLAAVLRTAENLAMFLRYAMEYTHDSPDTKKDPWEKGTEEKHEDFWQRPEETLLRTEHGKILGDCEDFAMLTHEILTRWGKKPMILHMPGHCTCIWFERNEHDNIDCYDIGTFGLGKNLWRYGVAKNGVENGMVYNGTEESAQGYTSAEFALNAILHKYRMSPVMNLEGWSADQNIYIMKPWWKTTRVGSETLKQPWEELPVERLKEFVTYSESAVPPPPKE